MHCCYSSFFPKSIIRSLILFYLNNWILSSCVSRWKSGSRTAEPRRGRWSRRSWVSLTAAGGPCTATRARWALCRFRGPSAPRTSTAPCTLLRWTPCHLSGIYSKWLWLCEEFTLWTMIPKWALRHADRTLDLNSWRTKLWMKTHVIYSNEMLEVLQIWLFIE